MYMLILSLRGGTDVRKHTQMNGRTDRRTHNMYRFHKKNSIKFTVSEISKTHPVDA